MHFYVLTLFPEMIRSCMETSIIGRAQDQNLICIEPVNIRDYTSEKHGHVDDYPYGGGAGMIMQAEPIVKAYRNLCRRTGKNLKAVYTSPQGKVFCQDTAKQFAGCRDMVFLCGHYEGVDERALELMNAESYSIGDYVLTGGELPAMVMIDAVCRMVPGVLTNSGSSGTESFEDGLLEYPQYTRPETCEGESVPEILLSGNHAKVEQWRREQSLKRTFERRPDLIDEGVLTKTDLAYLAGLGYRKKEG
jgi:tRNA (guanine37-N1)-methyltransferase